MSDLTTIATGILPASGYKAGTVYGIGLDNYTYLTLAELKEHVFYDGIKHALTGYAVDRMYYFDSNKGSYIIRFKDGAYQLAIQSDAFDFTPSRASVANRVNEQGLIEEVANDVCRVDYGDGECPVLLLEPARINLFLNSRTPVTQTVTVTSGSGYAVSVGGTGSLQLTGALTGTVTEGNDYANSTSSTSLVCTVVGSLDWVQVENASNSTRIIDTLGTSAVRQLDTLGFKTPNSALFNSKEGTFSVNMATLVNGGSSRSVTINDGTANNRVDITFSSTAGRVLMRIAKGGPSSYLASVSVDGFNQTVFREYNITWSATNISFFIDGVSQGDFVPASTLDDDTLDRVSFDYNSTGTQGFQGKVKSLYVLPTVLT